jgi:hypothetical protein
MTFSPIAIFQRDDRYEGAWQGHLDPHHYPSRFMGAARDILQSAVAFYCGVSSLVKERVGGFTGGGHDFGVLVGTTTRRCRSVAVRVFELHLHIKKVIKERQPGTPNHIRCFHISKTLQIIASKPLTNESDRQALTTISVARITRARVESIPR